MTERDERKMIVVFRKSRRKEPEGLGAEVTAVFPEEPADYAGRLMTCYAHVGQHGRCDRGFIYRTKPATREEFADLKAELEQLGYNLEVRLRITREMDDKRRARTANFNTGDGTT